MTSVVVSLAERLGAIPWESVAAHLDARGFATIAGLLSASECAALSETYALDAPFRKRIIMARHGFGSGEHKYFAYPLPAVVAGLRDALYPPLAQVANTWRGAPHRDALPAGARRLPRALQA